MLKNCTLSFILLLFATITLSQDTVRVDNLVYSNYEKLLNRKDNFVSEEARELWKYKNLKVEAVAQKNQHHDVLASAIKFTSRKADGNVRLMREEEYGYLDLDEIDSMVTSLDKFVAAYKDKPYAAEKTMIYNSRGSVYAACYLKNNKWRVAITTETGDVFTYTYFSVKKLQEFINVLKMYKSL